MKCEQCVYFEHIERCVYYCHSIGCYLDLTAADGCGAFKEKDGGEKDLSQRIADDEIRCGNCVHFKPVDGGVYFFDGSIKYDCICDMGKYCKAGYRGCLCFKDKTESEEPK